VCCVVCCCCCCASLFLVSPDSVLVHHLCEPTVHRGLDGTRIVDVHRRRWLRFRPLHPDGASADPSSTHPTALQQRNATTRDLQPSTKNARFCTLAASSQPCSFASRQSRSMEARARLWREPLLHSGIRKVVADSNLRMRTWESEFVMSSSNPKQCVSLPQLEFSGAEALAPHRAGRR
jgi:hypothetical protein